MNLWENSQSFKPNREGPAEFKEAKFGMNEEGQHKGGYLNKTYLY
jgi:hypothetical protein